MDSLPVCVIVSNKKTYICKVTSIVVCIDLSCKGPHRQIGMGGMLIPGSLGEMIRTMAQNERDVGSIPPASTICPIVLTPTT